METGRKVQTQYFAEFLSFDIFRFLISGAQYVITTLSYIAK